MKIAIPLAGGKLCMHFGHCQEFAFAIVNKETGKVESVTTATPPAHQPGVLPQWLKDNEVDTVIAGGMGMRAQQLFGRYGITVVTGAPALEPQAVAQQWLDGTLVTGDNVCDH